MQRSELLRPRNQILSGLTQTHLWPNYNGQSYTSVLQVRNGNRQNVPFKLNFKLIELKH